MCCCLQIAENNLYNIAHLKGKEMEALAPSFELFILGNVAIVNKTQGLRNVDTSHVINMTTRDQFTEA